MTGVKSLAAALVLLLVLSGCGAKGPPSAAELIEQPVIAAPPQTAKPDKPAEYTPGRPVTEDGQEAVTPRESVPPQEEKQTVFTLSFAGDCCLGTDHSVYGGEGTLVRVVGDDYAYPFANTLRYFEQDDFSMVNLECALTDSTSPVNKQYRFRGPPEYAKILTEGSIEFVTLANNHSYDYGEIGYKDTKEALAQEGIGYVTDGGTSLFTTESGLLIGIFAASSRFDKMSAGISSLKNQGADVIIAAFHFGTEGSYSYNSDQRYHARLAIDYGADIVYGAHPHVLQEIEEYGGGIILYSLGNFVFGGNRSPRDHDTAIVRQQIVKYDDGSFSLGETEIIPCDLSEYPGYNSYKPTPYAEGSREYLRTLSKLDGTFDGPDLYVSYSYGNEEPENPASETENPASETVNPTAETEDPTSETEETEEPEVPESPAEVTEESAGETGEPAEPTGEDG